ncbi:hypothetical protein P8452_08404 [Trifolium repens]|nr:hypothetical protein P8452_08404 [Trifolium repens]
MPSTTAPSKNMLCRCISTTQKNTCYADSIISGFPSAKGLSILAIEGLVHPLLLLQFGLPIWVMRPLLLIMPVKTLHISSPILAAKSPFFYKVVGCKMKPICYN